MRIAEATDYLFVAESYAHLLGIASVSLKTLSCLGKSNENE